MGYFTRVVVPLMPASGSIAAISSSSTHMTITPNDLLVYTATKGTLGKVSR